MNNIFNFFFRKKNNKEDTAAGTDDESRILLSAKQAEVLALQNQINPHFLYNVLDSIRGEALKAGVRNIADITEALSTYFRYTITETDSLVSLLEELENVDNYFKIQQYRFGDKLQMKVDLRGRDDAVASLKCPKLLLQPIVENSIYHGIEKKVDGGLIVIEIEEFTNKVEIWVRDNGVGMSEEVLEKLNIRLHRDISKSEQEGKHGIALHNVCRRIKLLFGEEYGIHVFSIQNIGTDIHISLPIIREG